MDWTIQDFGAIGEVAGAVAVFISLGYLALQLRQNTRALRANAAWDAEVIWGRENLSYAQNPEVMQLWNRASKAGAKLADFSDDESFRLYILARGCLQYAQAQWWLWKDGSLPDEVWQMRRRWARNYVSAPVFHEIWQADLKQHIYTEGFVEDIMAVERVGELSYEPASTG